MRDEFCFCRNYRMNINYPLTLLYDAACRVFARHRLPISRAAAPLIGAVRSWRARRVAARMARCQAGACRLDDQGE